jgi:tetratricopeptide (TPR) repeat protein
MTRLQHLRLATVCAALLLSQGPAQAQAPTQALKDTQWRQWLDAGRNLELERAARARLAQQPGDPDAAVALSLSAIEFADAKRLQDAASAATACAERQPQSAPCQFALGSVLGTQALQAGMLAGMRMATRVRETLARAVELDPLLFDARQALVQYHLAAPAVVGGSVDKARELTAALATLQPEQAKLLRASLHLHDGKPAQAEAELGSVRTGNNAELADDLRQAWVQVGYDHRRQKRWREATAAFDLVSRDWPRSAHGPYGRARVAADQGQHDEAIALFERCRSLEGAVRLPIDLRQGQAYLAKGDKAKGRELLLRFVASDKDRPVNARQLAEAKKLLEEGA